MDFQVSDFATAYSGEYIPMVVRYRGKRLYKVKYIILIQNPGTAVIGSALGLTKRGITDARDRI